MFSGIIESKSKIIRSEKSESVLRIWVQRPAQFDDIKIGDSICTNGVCLTVEKFDSQEIQFCLGQETLHILQNNLTHWLSYGVNLERSLKFGDRVHGHLVTGHVDSIAQVVRAEADGECWQLQIKLPIEHSKFVWKKGSICISGVSLTVNEAQNGLVSVCLIPETMAATNLIHFSVGDSITFETDYLAKSYIYSRSNGA